MSARPVVVLLHGVGLDHSVWDDVVDRMGSGVEVLTPDLPGHAGGPRVPDDLDLATLADQVAVSVPEGSHLVGFSLGALVAQQLAATRPELAASLISVSSVCRRTDEERAAVLGRLAASTEDPAAGVDASLARWFDGTAVDPATVEHTRAVLTANDPAQYLACYRVFATGDADVAPRLGSITCPSLAVTGSDDPGSTPEMAHRLADAVAGCRAQVLPGVRHMLPVQAPDVLAATITDFVGGVHD